MEKELIHQELSKTVIGAAMTVWNGLRPGLDEKLYENALFIEFQHRGLKIEQQRQFPVLYHEQRIGILIPDLIVDNRIIVDAKVATTFNNIIIAKLSDI